jgi:hypothetical protein
MAPASLPPFNPDELPGPRPDSHRVLTDRDGHVTARCSLWWRQTVPLSGLRTGIIGHYGAATSYAATRLLHDACRELSQKGCKVAVGPMDGNTWGSYRFVTGGAGAPPFLLEPTNPPEWPEQFAAFGFKPLAEYHSTVTEHLDCEDSKADRAERTLAKRGYQLRHLDASTFTTELRAIFRISLAAFRNSFLYQPASEGEFLASLERLIPLVDPKLVLVATQHGHEVGFVFAIPDHLQAVRGQTIDTAIIKTLAIMPGREHAGLGIWMVRQLHRAAMSLNYRRVIHALMHESNGSLNISRRYARHMRSYTLFSKPL